MRPFRWPRRVRGWACCVLFPLFPIVSLAARAENYNFNKDDGGWTSPGPAPNWVYGQLQANEKSWKAFCPEKPAASFLLSPCFRIDDKTIDVDFGHRFRFENDPVGKQPIGAGQVQYSLDDGGTWLGISTWSSQGDELAPTFTPSWPDTVPPLLAPGLAFVGTSPKYFNSPSGGGNFNDSSFQLTGLDPGGEISFRFVAAMFGPVCPECDDTFDAENREPCDAQITPLWDLNRFHVRGVTEQPCVPEPTGLGLLAAGVAAATLLFRRRVSFRKIAGFLPETSPMGRPRLPSQAVAAKGWTCRDGRESSSLARTPRRAISEDELLGSSALPEAPAQRRPTWVITETWSFTRPFLLRRQPRRRACGRSGCRRFMNLAIEETTVALSRWVLAGTVALLLPFVSARAETNVNFNFEPNDQGWTTQTIGAVEQPWTYSNTTPNKGWQAFRGADGVQSGSYLISPLLYLDPPAAQNQKYVAVRIKHFFDFGLEADPWSLGQVQYSYAGGPWEGIRTADFDSTSSEHYAPTYANPPSPFISATDIPVESTPVDAWAGETNGFDDRTHRDSYFQLNYGASFTDPYPFAEGQTIQFRLLAGTLDPLLMPGSPQLIWEVTAVEVIHAGVVPEPAAIGMAATGVALAIISLRRRMRHRPRMT